MEEKNLNIFEKFFNEMKKRIEQKQFKYGDEWKEVDLAKLKIQIIKKFGQWAMLNVNNVEKDMDLIDIANQCMLLWARKLLIKFTCPQCGKYDKVLKILHNVTEYEYNCEKCNIFFNEMKEVDLSIKEDLERTLRERNKVSDETLNRQFDL